MSNNTSSEELHKCRVCCKTFSRRTYLVLHEKIHGEKSYKCDICGKAFSQPAGLWIHKKHQSCLKRNSSSESRAETDEQGGKEKSSVEKRHECDICNKRFSQKHLLSYHMRTHTGENPYPCTTCGKTFRGAVTLKYHERTHTGQKPHTCIFCTKSFTQLGPLRAHCRKEHQSDRIYECDVCKEKFEKFLELSSHKKTHLETCTDSQCGDVGISNTERVNASIHVTNVCCQNLDKLKKIDQDSDPDAVKTPTSSKRDAPEPSSEINSKKRKRKVQAKSSPRRKIRLNKSVGEAVIRSYTEGENSCVLVKEKLSTMVSEKLKTINYRDLSFPNSHTPAIHQNEKNSLNEQTHKCDVCGEEFPEANVLQNHAITHTEKNPLNCTDCNKSFRTPGSLTVHQRTHNGKRPYKCIFCPQDFTQRGALLQHCRRIHNTDQIYECDVCNEKFEKHRDLLSHNHTLSDAPCTMAKRTYMYENTDFDVTFEDDEEKTGDDAVCSPLSSSNKNGDSIPENNHQVSAKGSCIVTNDDNKKNCAKSPNFIYQEDEFSRQDDYENRFTSPSNSVCIEVENIDIPVSKEDYDSYDSGISPDTSPFDVNVKCDEPPKQLMYEVSMQPIKPCYKENNYHQIIGMGPSKTISSRTIPSQQSQNLADGIVKDCLKTVNNEDESDDHISSNCSRVTTPDNVSLFQESPGSNHQNFCLFDETSDMSLQFHNERNMFTAQPLNLRKRSLMEGNIRNFWQRNDCVSGIGCDRGRNLQNNSTQIGSTSELPGCSNISSNESLW